MQKNGHIDYKLKTELLGSQLSVESAIVNYADEKDVDLIVLGTKGTSGLKKLLLGSVASALFGIIYCSCFKVLVTIRRL